jgi:hypothetical protein
MSDTPIPAKPANYGLHNFLIFSPSKQVNHCSAATIQKFQESLYNVGYWGCVGMVNGKLA